jgi:hypothetical protein
MLQHLRASAHATAQTRPHHLRTLGLAVMAHTQLPLLLLLLERLQFV